MRRLAALAALAMGVVIAAPAAASALARTSPEAPVRPARLLVLSLPGLTWADLRAHPMPNLERVLRSSAVADLTTRAVSRRTTLGDGYATLGAGARAKGVPEVDGLGLAVDERFGTDTAGAAYRVRTGRTASTGIVDLALPDLLDRNAGLNFDAHIGALGDALSHAGYERAVIANGDGAAPVVTPDSYRRQAVAALMDHGGRVPAGQVDAGLLRRDPDAPFGVRLDQGAVTSAFDRVWRTRSVVLVEGSDLVRADAYRSSVTPARRGLLLAQAMDATDQLVGALLRRVDLARDAVVVVGPAHSSRRPALTVAALHAPGVSSGLLSSGTTRRVGFVQLVDLAPTVLARLELARPDSMEGRPVEVNASNASLRSRVERLARADHAATFRDRQTPIAAHVYVSLVITLVLVALALFAVRLPGLVALQWAALSLLAFLPLTYLAGFVRFDDLGSSLYWLFLVGGSIVVGGALLQLRRHPLDPLLAALGLIVGLTTLDLLAGGRLQFNTAFGYSPIVAGRFQGMGNLAYAMYACAGILLAALLVFRARTADPRCARMDTASRVAVALVAVIVLVDGLPFLGADVGGVLSLVPAVGVFVTMLLGWRVRWKVLLAWIGGGVLATIGVGLLDLTRPPDSRTHLGRLLEKIGTGDFGAVGTVIERKLHANLSVLTSVWIAVVPVTFALLVYLASRWSRDVVRPSARVRELRAAAAALAIVVVLGFALNDSGIAVPGMMFGVLDSALVFLVAYAKREVEPAPGEADLSALAEGGAVASPRGRERAY